MADADAGRLQCIAEAARALVEDPDALRATDTIVYVDAGLFDALVAAIGDAKLGEFVKP